MLSKIEYFQEKILKILTPRQKLQILPSAIAQVKAYNTPEHFVNQMRQITYSL